MDKKNWGPEAEKLGKEITEDYVAGMVKKMRLRTAVKDFMNVVFDGFGSVLRGLLK